MTAFEGFPKIARLNRDCVITEKLDGTNASILITEGGDFHVGSRTRWITPANDNYGFARWAEENKGELMRLGPGHHFGEWWGNGIQRGYGQKAKRFSLFNVSRWSDESVRPLCCDVVPVLFIGPLAAGVEQSTSKLRIYGSVAAPGFMNPEGVVIWHTAARQMFKVTLEKDQEPKSISLKEAA